MNIDEISKQKDKWIQEEAPYCKYQRIIVSFGTIAMAIAYGSLVNSQGLFVVPLINEFNYTKTEVSAIMSFQAVGSMIGAVCASKIIDKYDVKKCVVFFAFVIGIATAVFSKMDQLWGFYLCALINGIAIAGTTTLPISVLINRWFDNRKRGFAIGVAFMGSGIGGLVLNPVLNRVIDLSGWRIAFLAIGGMFLCIYIPLAVLMVRNSPKEPDGIQAENANKRKTIKHKTEYSFMQMVKNKYFWAVGLAVAMISAVGTSMVYYVASYYVSIGYSSEKSALIVGLSVGCIAVGKIMVGYCIDKFSAAWTIFLSYGILGVCLILLYVIRCNDNVLAPILLSYGIGIGSVTIAVPMIVNSLFGDQDFTKMMGAMSMIAGSGAASGPVICGIIIDKTGSYGNTWIALSVAAFASAILVLLCFRMRGSASSHSDKLNKSSL